MCFCCCPHLKRWCLDSLLLCSTMPYFRYSCKLHTKLQPLNFVKAAPEIGWWSHLAWQWCPTLTGLWRLSHQRTLWGLALCYFLEWEAWSLTPFYLLTILDTAFQSFLARVSHRDVGIGLGTFPTPWFALAVTLWKPKTSCHWLPGRERCGKRKC